MKKKDIVISTVAVTTVMLMAAVGYSCSKQKNPNDIDVPAIERQIDTEVDTEIEVSTTESNIIIPPTVLSYEKEVELDVGESLTLEMFNIKLGDNQDVEYHYPTDVYDTVGEFEDSILVTDKVSGVSAELPFKVIVVDKSAPVIEGTKDITVIEGDNIDLLEGVSATDNLDGDITSEITVSEYIATALDKDQVITYSVTDKAGNTTTKDIILHIKSNPIEVLDKTMYATSSVNVRSKSSAESDKIGSLSYAQSVHVTGQDKNTGWYRIEYEGGTGWASNSYLSDTKPKVETPKKTTSTTKKDTPTASDCTSNCKSNDCTSDCISDCDCSTNVCPTPGVANCDEPLEPHTDVCSGW